MTPQEYIKREQEIQEAMRTYPRMEVGEAYARWKIERGEEPAPKITSGDSSIQQARQVCQESAKRPCPQSGCDGVQLLESVCGGCVEGRAGYKSKWTCEKCLHRELSKKEYLEWILELASSSKPQS